MSVFTEAGEISHTVFTPEARSLGDDWPVGALADAGVGAGFGHVAFASPSRR